MSMNNTTTKKTLQWTLEVKKEVTTEGPQEIADSFEMFLYELHQKYPQSLFPYRLYEVCMEKEIFECGEVYYKEVHNFRADLLIYYIAQHAHEVLELGEDHPDYRDIITEILDELNIILRTKMGDSISGKITWANIA